MDGTILQSIRICCFPSGNDATCQAQYFIGTAFFLVYCWSVAFLALTCKCVALSVMFTFVFPLIFGTSLQHILNPHICCEKQIGYEYAVNGQSLN